MEFWNETAPRSQKSRKCDACGHEIAAGEQYAYMSGKWEGEFFTVTQHTECRAAEVDMAREKGLHGGDEWVHLNDLDEPEDLLWLEGFHPVVFERIKERYAHWLEDAQP